ncbi:MAG: sugar kinase [Gemmatimonadaceae bacterium]|jgi:2-dehydro-3-deoxygluconokinase|nr:sugar kinase [Gemmatimonadaceae bacterium]
MSTGLVAFGELMLRFSPPAGERLLQSPVLRTNFGGSEANVAVGYAQLGHPATFVTALPPSVLGDAAIAALRAEGLDTRHVVRREGRLGTYYVEGGSDCRPMRVVYDREHAAIRALAPDDVAWEAVLDGATWLHVSGITAALGETCLSTLRQAVATARRLGVRTSVDLNWRPALWAGRDPQPVLVPLVDDVALLVANVHAIRAMLGIGADEADAATIARAVQARHGAHAVAVTTRDVVSASRHHWQAGWLAARGAAWHASPSWDVQVTDRVGGGDAFVAGLLHAIDAGMAPQAAIDFAAATGALKLTVPGDFNRVTVAEVEQAMRARQGR